MSTAARFQEQNAADLQHGYTAHMAQIWGDVYEPYVEEVNCGSCGAEVGELFPCTWDAKLKVGACCAVHEDDVAVAVNECRNCLQTADRLTASPLYDDNFLVCDDCMEEAVAITVKNAARIATEGLLVRAGCTRAESAAYIAHFEELA